MGIARGGPGRVKAKSSALSTVTSTLQSYAERGVFRGFSVEERPAGRLEYRFTWLTRRPMTARFDPKTSALTFASLFPDVDPRSRMVAELRALVAERSSRNLPDHKRLDRRRVTIACSVRRGHLSLSIGVRGGHHGYAVRKALNLINELFLVLHETYPDYLIQHFGVSAE